MNECIASSTMRNIVGILFNTTGVRLFFWFCFRICLGLTGSGLLAASGRRSFLHQQKLRLEGHQISCKIDG
jgi:hypothetical protein